jgi:hypothetical protein
MSEITVFVVPSGVDLRVSLDSLEGVDPSNLDELCKNPDFISRVGSKVEKSNFVLVRTANEDEKFTDVGLVCVCSDSFNAEIRVGAEYDKLVTTPALKRKAALTLFKQVIDGMNYVGKKEAVRAGVVSMSVNLTNMAKDPKISPSSKETVSKLGEIIADLYTSFCENPCLYEKTPSFFVATQFTPSGVSRPELVNLETEYNRVMQDFYQACSDFVSLFHRLSPPSVESSPLGGGCGGGFGGGLSLDSFELEFELEKERKKSEESSRIQAKYVRERVEMEAENKRLKSRVEELERRPPPPTGPSPREAELERVCVELQTRNKDMESRIQELEAREKAMGLDAKTREAELQKKLDEAKLACKALQDEISQMKAQPKINPTQPIGQATGQPTKQTPAGGSGFGGFPPPPGQQAAGASPFTGYHATPNATQPTGQPTKQTPAGGSGFGGFPPPPGQQAAGASPFTGYHATPNATQPTGQPTKQTPASGSGFGGFAPLPGQQTAGANPFAGYHATPNATQPPAGGSGFGGFGK